MTAPEIAPPLAALGGTTPPAPAWFHEMLALAPERRFHEVDGARIETLVWGERGRPGLLFLHGNAAHADWWSFIAPFFLPQHRVVALSWSGMGSSDWREEYSLDGFVAEALMIAELEGLFASRSRPVVVGHSFGGVPTAAIAGRCGERIGAAVLVDSPLMSREQREERRRRRGGPARSEDRTVRPHRIYPDVPSALARYRFLPPQHCENLYAVDYIARRSLREVTQPAPGVTWRFDPSLWAKYRHGDPTVGLDTARCPVAIIWGSESKLVDEGVIAWQRSKAPPGTPSIEIPEAGHHLMLDQPIAFVTALRALLAGWPAGRETG
jgi:pimeloyl-ACP methyl ester carboxylesterase